MRRLGKTPPFRGPRGEIKAGSIAEVAYRRLGGIDQWVMIRGQTVQNPPLIILHGGPGFSDTQFFRRFNAALEEWFTVVYWDQRGTGKSFRRDIPRSSMNVEQFVSDLDELVDLVRQRLQQPQVVLLGHSWGTVLGPLHAARFPDKVSTYIGVAQVGDWAEGERLSYAQAMAEAQRRNHRRALDALVAIGPPPHTAQQLWTLRDWSQRLAGQRAAALRQSLVIVGGEASVLEVPDILAGFRFSIDAMWDEVSRVNMFERVPALSMPVFMMLGRNDPWIPPAASVAYFDALAAPRKELFWFERSGHEPFTDEPERFNTLMRDVVRPSLATPAVEMAMSP